MRDTRRATMTLALLLPLGCIDSTGIEPLPKGSGTSTEGNAPADSLTAAQLVQDLRTRFLADDARTAAPGVDQPFDHALFPRSHFPSLVRGQGGWVPDSANAQAAPVEVVFPERYSDRLAVRDVKSALAFEIRVQRAAAAAAEEAEGYLVYRGNLGQATTGLYRASEDGFEDYVVFEQAPAEPRVEYVVTLSENVAGLRLVENQLELLDATGTPRLRVAPPFLIDADGARTEAELSVPDCQADMDPAAPWGRPVVSPGARDCTVRISWSDQDLVYPVVLDPSWSSTRDMGVIRAYHTATRLSTGRILVAGGVTTGGAVVRSAELFDPGSSTWSSTGSMAKARSLHSATSVSTNEVVVLGGYTAFNATPTNIAERYNPSKGTWTTAGSPGTARAAHAAVRLADGTILASGGLDSSGKALATVQRYTPSNTTWSSRAALPNARAFHTSTLLGDGTVLVAGGRSSSTGGPVAAASRYTLSTDKWASAGDLIVPRYNHTAEAFVVSGVEKVWLAGGQTTSGSTITPSTEVYLRGTPGTWTRSANLTFPRRNHTATSVNGRILVAGGIGSDNAAVGVSEVLNPTWETLAETPSLATARAYHAAVLTDNTHVLVSGGSNAASLAKTSTYFKSAEIFDGAFPAVHISEHQELGVWVPEVSKADPMWDPDQGFWVDMWARYYRPATLVSGVRYPVLVFLHGNHGSCGKGSNPRIDDGNEYTYTGQCSPAGEFPIIVPNHLGYEYIATELASRGYFVVSINANRGITPGAGTDDDPNFIFARGNLALKHLEYLSRWNRGLDPTPSELGVSYQGRLDFDQVGLMGHSRGGEGMRAAVELYRRYDNPDAWDSKIGSMQIKALFEIGPTDGKAWEGSVYQGTEHRVFLTAQDVKWAVMLPMCDGDVHTLTGIRAFDRMVTFQEWNIPSMKASYTVWGANHNYFNTEWQQNESSGCVGTDNRALFSSGTGVSGSAEQRQAGFHAMLKFFTATVGANATPQEAMAFIPGGWTPPEPRVERGFTWSTYDAYTWTLENFTGLPNESQWGYPFDKHSVAVSAQGSLPEHDYPEDDTQDQWHKGVLVTWDAGGSNTYFQINWAASGAGMDLSSNWTNLSLRVDRARDTARNSETAPTQFNVQLVAGNGSLSAAQKIDTSVGLKGPVGSYNDDLAPQYHSMLQTAVLPLSRFTGIDRSSVRGVRFVFNQSSKGAIYLADIAATTPMPWDLWLTGGYAGFRSTAARPVAPLAAPGTTIASQPQPKPMPTAAPTVTSGNTVRAIRIAGSQGQLVDIELQTTTRIPIRNAELRMAVGKVTTVRSRFGGPGREQVTFRLRRAEFDQMLDGQPVYVFFEDGSTGPIWDFGPLDRSLLK